MRWSWRDAGQRGRALAGASTACPRAVVRALPADCTLVHGGTLNRPQACSVSRSGEPDGPGGRARAEAAKLPARRHAARQAPVRHLRQRRVRAVLSAGRHARCGARSRHCSCTHCEKLLDLVCVAACKPLLAAQLHAGSGPDSMCGVKYIEIEVKNSVVTFASACITNLTLCVCGASHD